MAYSFQTFVASSVLTSAQMNQVEVNIRDHVHGADGVGPVGLSWIRESKSAGFTVAGSDAGKIFDCTGDFTIDFASAATLGDGFAVSVKNVASGRIMLAPFGTQTIDATSYFVVTPLEAINVYSDAANLSTFGHTKGWVKLWERSVTSSIANVTIDKMFPNDFSLYMLKISGLTDTGVSQTLLRVSVDSGSTFISTNYSNTVSGTSAVSNAVILWHDTGNVTTIVTEYTTPTSSTPPIHFRTRATHYVGAAGGIEDALIAGTWTPNSGQINALQILPSSNAIATAEIGLWGLR